MLNWFHPSEEIAMTLSELRQARGLLTQRKLGARLGTSQAAVGAFEKRDDVLLSKLRDYIEALGGQLELTATFPSGHRVRLKQFTPSAVGGTAPSVGRAPPDDLSSTEDDGDSGEWTVVG